MQENLKAWELVVKPRASIVVSQSVFFLGPRIGVTPSSPDPKRCTWSDATEEDAIRADL